jgi:hypothetical protein
MRHGADTGKATAGPSTALRSGRDDNFYRGGKDFSQKLFRPQQNCHPDRSVAQWRDPRLLPRDSHT